MNITDKPSEAERLADLHSYGILDSPPDVELNEIVELASKLCNTPISLISLVDRDRQWFLAKWGIDVDEMDKKCTICDYALQNLTEVMVIEDTLEDSRFSDNPLVVGEPNMRFYAGVPLVSKNNYGLGTLCIIDTKPRKLSDEERRLLKLFANRIMDWIELRRENKRQKRIIESKDEELNLVMQRFIEAQQVAKVGSWDWDIGSGKLYWSPEMFDLFGMDKTIKPSNLLQSWQSLVHAKDLEMVKNSIVDVLSGDHRVIQYRIRRSGENIWVETIGKAVKDEKGKVVRMLGTVQDITYRRNADEQKQYYGQMLESMLFDLSHKIRHPLAKVLSLIDILKDYENSPKQRQDFISHLQGSAKEFDGFIREMSDFIQVNKEEISEQKNAIFSPLTGCDCDVCLEERSA